MSLCLSNAILMIVWYSVRICIFQCQGNDMIDVSKASNPPESFEFPDLSDVGRGELIEILNNFAGETRLMAFSSDCVSDERQTYLQMMILMSAVLFTGRVSIDDKPLEIMNK